MEQSARCSVHFLLKVLDINNRCDLNYKTSNNKRLHLEISLMQMCAGVLQPEPAKAASPPAAAQPVAPAPPVTAAPVVSAPPPVATSAGAPAATVAPEKKMVEPVKMKDLHNRYESPTSINKPVPPSSAAISDDDTTRSEVATPFTQAELSLAWDEYADRLKNQYPHLYSTLKSSRPSIMEDWTIFFTFENKVLEDELTGHKTELMEFLRTRLNNFKLKLQTTIAEVQKTRKPYTDREKFELMAEKNPNLRTFRDVLDLDIEY